MTTREWTKLLKEHTTASTIEVNGEFVRGKIVITRHRTTEKEQRHYSFNEYKNQVIKIKESEIDVTFDGEVKSSMGNWYPSKDYSKRQLNNWFRSSKDINDELKLRLKLIGGSSEYKIKTITLL